MALKFSTLTRVESIISPPQTNTTKQLIVKAPKITCDVGCFYSLLILCNPNSCPFLIHADTLMYHKIRECILELLA